MRLRIRLLTAIFILLFVAVATRLGFWQILKGRELSEDARSQHASSSVTAAPRGNIIAADGSYWVLRDTAWLVYANANLIKDSSQKIANVLAPFFVEDTSNKGELLTEAERLTGLLSKKGAWIP